MPVATPPEANGELRNRVQLVRLDNQLGKGSAGRSSGSSWLPWMLCGLLAITWAGVGMRGYRNGSFNGATATTTAENNSSGSKSNANDTPVDAPAGSIQLLVKGYIIPAQQIAVSPIDVAGKLIELYVVEGQFYKVNTILAEIDKTSFQATYDETAESLNAARKRLEAIKQRLAEIGAASVRKIEIDQVDAQINEAIAQRDRAADDEKRVAAVSGASGKEVAQVRNDLLAAQARLKKFEIDKEILIAGPRKEKRLAAEADVAAGEADVKAAEARLIQAKWRLDNCTIRAPLSGTVLNKKAEKYNLVNPLAFAATSGSVCDMADLSNLEVDLEIPVREIAKLKVGQLCRVRCDAYPKRLYEGRLDRIMPIANRANQIVNVRVKVALPPEEAKDPFLKPGMGADVSFLAEAK